jgi:hypothetical protein
MRRTISSASVLPAMLGESARLYQRLGGRRLRATVTEMGRFAPLFREHQAANIGGGWGTRGLK